MKVNESEKIWINPATDLPKLSGHIDKDSVEYIRADAFIEKVANYLNYVLYDRVEIRKPGTLIPSLCTKGEVIEDFKTYMEDKI